MAIKFTMAKRGVLPNEEQPAEGVVKGLRPRLEHRPTIDVVEFQDQHHWGSVLRGGDIAHALAEIRHILLHEMEKGNAVTLPGIGTFRLSLKGEVEVRNGNVEDGGTAYYHGRNVRVDDILFQPDRKLREEVRRFEVSQSPYGQAIAVDDDEIEARFTELFAHRELITHKDVHFAFEAVLTKHRITSLLKRLTAEGRLIRIGRGPQTCYRAAKGQFGQATV